MRDFTFTSFRAGGQSGLSAIVTMISRSRTNMRGLAAGHASDATVSQLIDFVVSGSNSEVSGAHLLRPLTKFWPLPDIGLFMVTSFEAFRDGMFGIFYIMTEQNSQQAKHISFGTLRRFVLYLIDAGQVFNAIVLPEFGWKPSVLSFIRKFDFFALIFDLVSARPGANQFYHKQSNLMVFIDWVYMAICLQCSQVSPNFPRVPLYVISVVLVAFALLVTAIAMRLFQVRHASKFFADQHMY